jgi:hypothetical protein
MAGGKDMSLPVFISLNVVMLFISVPTPYFQGSSMQFVPVDDLPLNREDPIERLFSIGSTRRSFHKDSCGEGSFTRKCLVTLH